MPVYLNRENAENVVPLAPELQKGTWGDTESVVGELSKRIVDSGAKVVCLDGWLGIDWATLIDGVKNAIGASRSLVLVPSNELLADVNRIEAYHKPFSETEESFGYVNKEGSFSDIVDEDSVARISADLKKAAADDLYLVYGPGAGAVLDHFDLVSTCINQRNNV